MLAKGKLEYQSWKRDPAQDRGRSELPKACSIKQRRLAAKYQVPREKRGPRCFGGGYIFLLSNPKSETKYKINEMDSHGIAIYSRPETIENLRNG